MLGLKVKEYLDRKGIKYSDISKKTGIPMNILSIIFNGKRGMKAGEYISICDAIGVPLDMFAEDPEKVSNKYKP